MGLTKYEVAAALQTPRDVTHRKAPMRERYLSIPAISCQHLSAPSQAAAIKAVA